MAETQTKCHVTEGHFMVNIAVFGLGNIGMVHLDNLKRIPKANIKYCVEESIERIHLVQNKLKLTEPETTFLKPAERNKVFQDKSVEAVVICTPTYTHEELILASLEAGKAVFCEKPLAFTEKGIEKCIEASKKYQKPLMCGFNRRFDPGLRSLKKRVDAGEIGKISVMKICSREPPKPNIEYLKTSGGIFLDSAVHDIDYMCWVLGEYPVNISSYGHAHLEDVKEIGDYDTVVITMKFPSGAIGIIDLSRWCVYGYDQRVEAFGSKGMLTCGEQKPTGLKCHNEEGSIAVPIFFSYASRYKESYGAEMEHFLNVCQGTEECEVKPESTLIIFKILSACANVVNSGKPVNVA